MIRGDVFIVGASVLLICDQDFRIIQNGGVAYAGGRIVETGDFNRLACRYKNSHATFHSDCVMMPALINSHIHFEFSKNDGLFRYGGFDVWLNSVIENREEVLRNNQECMRNAVEEQKANGVGCVCAISSHDLDFDEVVNSKLRVVYAIETIGVSQKEFNNQVSLLSSRLERAMKMRCELFIPALAIHSPYSVHLKLAKYVLSVARELNLVVSAHFLESIQELEWLEHGSGFFKEFYRENFGLDIEPSFTPESFLNMFYDVKAMFTHCLFANKNIETMIWEKGSVVSCPRSNMLLSSRMGNNFIVATDGRSSNNNTSLLEEMRHAFLYELGRRRQNKFEDVAKGIIKAVTSNPSRAMGLNNGVMMPGKDADIAIFKLSGMCKNQNHTDNVCSHFLLNSKCVRTLIVNGSNIYSQS